MIVTKYTCDRCGHTQNTNDQMWSVGVFAWIGWRRESTAPRKECLWCHDCCVQYGLLPTSPTETVQPLAQETSLEDIIRGIVKQEMLNSEYGEPID